MGKIILLSIFILSALAVLWLLWMLLRPKFFRELRYLDAEIARTTGEERETWRKQRKRHLMTMIPFVKYKK